MVARQGIVTALEYTCQPTDLAHAAFSKKKIAPCFGSPLASIEWPRTTKG